MSRKQAFQPSTPTTEQSQGRRQVVHSLLDAGCLTIAQVCARISMPRRTFTRLRDAGQLPFLEEVQPRLGMRPRYRADLVEQYVAGTFNRSPLAIVRRRRA